MTSTQECAQYLEMGARLEKRLYRFALMQTGSRAAAEKALTEALVACFRTGAGGGDAKVLETKAFSAIFDLSQNAPYAAEDPEDDIPPTVRPLYARLSGLTPLERAAVILTCLC